MLKISVDSMGTSSLPTVIVYYFKSLVPQQYSEQFIFHGWQDREATDLILRKAKA